MFFCKLDVEGSIPSAPLEIEKTYVNGEKSNLEAHDHDRIERDGTLTSATRIKGQLKASQHCAAMARLEAEAIRQVSLGAKRKSTRF
jgi:hypothetical protein